MISYDSLTGTTTQYEVKVSSKHSTNSHFRKFRYSLWSNAQYEVKVSSGTIAINASDTAIDFSQYKMKPISIPPIKTDQIYTDILQIFSEYQDQAEVEAEAEQISNLSIKNFIYGRIQ